MILDTDFLISLDEGRSDAVQKATELEAASVPLRISAVTVQELYIGVGAGETSFENASTYEALVEHKPVVGIDGQIARRAGVIQGIHLTSDSKPNLGLADAIIAATALRFDEPIVTSDRDFTRIDGVTVDPL